MTAGLEPVPAHLKQYVDYINNTGQVPLKVEDFDEDWEPVGPMVRPQLEAGGFIYYGGKPEQFNTEPGIYLRPDLATR